MVCLAGLVGWKCSRIGRPSFISFCPVATVAGHDLRRDAGMVNQGRLTKVIIVLVVSMTVGALVLLTLEGKPIKPMAFSLSSQTQLPSVHQVLGTTAGIDVSRWRRIEISYVSSEGVPSLSEGRAGVLSVRYHFIIGNGRVGRDGEVYASHRWIKQFPCLDDSADGDGRDAIRICIIADTRANRMTPRQASQLEMLVSSLNRNCRTEFPISWNYM